MGWKWNQLDLVTSINAGSVETRSMRAKKTAIIRDAERSLRSLIIHEVHVGVNLPDGGFFRIGKL
jgi:hypothetical protein